MKSKISIFLVCILLLFSTLAVAQERAIIKGTVKDAEGNPLYGANVYIKGIEIGARINLGSATLPEGDYEFIVPGKYVKGQEVTLYSSFMGYKLAKTTITLKSGTITQDFVMELDVLDMDAVVVTGLIDETPRKKLAFTVDKVEKEALELAPAVNAGNAIRGKVASAVVRSGGGRPGDGVSIRLRGATSISLSNSPLIIVDGVITNASIRDIDAMDIESIEVVKGAAASSLYGSRAAAGVIQIKTRRGTGLKLNQTRILIRNEYGFNQIARMVKLSRHHHYKVNEHNQFIDNDGNVLKTFDELKRRVVDDDNIIDNEYEKTYDQFDLYFDPGTFYTNTASISHNTRNTNFRVSFTNMQESGIVKALKGYNRKNARINLDHTIQEGLNFSMNGYFAQSWRDREGGVNPWYSLMFQPANANLLQKNADGTPYIIQVDPFIIEENPLYAFHNIDYEDRRLRIMGSFSLRYTPTYWFNLEANFSYDRSDRNSNQYVPKGYKTIDASTLNMGRYRKSNAYNQAINTSITASFNKAFGDLGTKAKLRYLYESQHNDSFTATGQDLVVKGVKSFGVVQGEKMLSSYMTDIRSLGYYFVGGADYKERYIMDFLLRRDGSSLFGPENRWNTYYRISGAWRVAQEPWWFTDKINELKLRYSLGTAGGRPSFAAQYETFSVSAGSVSKSTLGNKRLKPQLSIEQEIGIDIAFLDRFSFDFTYANTETRDQILSVPLAGYYGYTSQYQNAGTLRSWTFESSLNAVILSKRDYSWSARLIFDRTRQKILKLNRPPWRGGPNNNFYYREGEIFGRLYGDKFMTSLNELKTYKGGIHANSMDQFQINDDGLLVPVGSGKSWKDGLSKNLWGTKVTIDGVVYDWGLPIKYENEEGKTFWPIGNVIPDFNLAFTNNFRWKGFQVYVLFDASIGGDIYNETRQWSYRELNHGDCDQAGKPEYAKKPTYYLSKLYNVNANISWFVESGTFVKLREMNVRYTFTRAQLNKLFGGFLGRTFSRVSLGIIGRNLYTWTKYTGWDPDVGTSDATIYRIDDFGYPHFRTFTGFLEFEF
ncbi:hypothetical protein DRQ09_03325 [candidate division KSB1 bacterium]|nr:MAG: hypothetical protein DRQ09_03325 [candidate division KSB1 bacterium]